MQCYYKVHIFAGPVLPYQFAYSETLMMIRRRQQQISQDISNSIYNIDQNVL